MRDPAVVDSVDIWLLRSRDRFRNPRRGNPEQPRRVGEGQPEAREEAFAVLPIGHDLPPLDPAEDDVVHRAGGIEAGLAGHGRSLCTPRESAKLLRNQRAADTPGCSGGLFRRAAPGFPLGPVGLHALADGFPRRR